MAESYSITAVLEAKVDGLVSGFKQATSTVDGFVKKNEETFKSFKMVGAAATAGGIAVAGGLAFAVKKAAEFEGAMSSVAAISGATGKDFDDLSQAARDWGASTSFSATEAAEGLEYMALAGWDTQQMLGGIGPVLHLAEAGALDLGRASDLVTDSMAGLGLEVKDLDGYLDKVAKTAASSNTDIDTLMEAFVIAGGTFDRFNVPLEEANAFLGVMANRGFKGAEAGTAVNAIMSRLTTTTGPAAEALKGMGVSAYDSAGNFRGMETVLEEVRGKLDKMTDAEKANAMTKLAGLNHGKTFNAMLEGLGDEYGDLKGKIVDSDGALKEMRDTMKDNLQGAMENLSSAFEEIAISIGTALLPAVKKMAEFVQLLADKFNGLDDKTKTIIAVIAALSAGFLLLVGPILLLIGFIPSILAGFAALSTVFTALGTAILAINWPITLMVAAVIAAATLIYVYWEPISNFFVSLWGGIVGVTKSAGDSIKSVIDGIAPTLEYLGGVFTQVFEGILGVFGKIKGALSIVADFFNFENALSMVKETAMLLAGVLMALLGPWGILASLLLKVFTQTSLVEDAFKVLKGEMDFGELIDNLLSTFEGLVSNFSDVAGKFITIGGEMVSSLIDGISSNSGTLVNGLGDLMTSIVSTVLGLLPKLLSTGAKLLTALANGISAAMPVIANTIAEVLPLIIEILIGALNTIIEVGLKIILMLIEGIISGVSQFTEIAVQLITLLVETIVGLIPVIIEVGLQIIQALLDGIIFALPLIIQSAIDLILMLVEGIIQALPVLIEVGITILMTLIDALLTAIPLLIGAAILIILALVNALIAAIPQIIAAGIQLIMGLIEGIIAVIPELISAAIELIMALVGAIIQLVPALLQAGITIIIALVKGVIQVLPQLIAAGIKLIIALVGAIIKLVPALLSAGIQLIVALVKGVLSILGQLLSAAGTLITGLISKVLSFIGNILSAGKDLIVSLVSGVLSVAGDVLSAGMDIGSTLIDSVLGFAGGMLSAGKDLVSGLIDGIASMGKAAIGAITGVVDGVVNKAKSLLGIKSPSRVFMAMGGFISEGAAIGINKAKDLAIKASEALGLGVENAFNPQLATDGVDIAGQVNSINRQANRQMQSHLTSEMNVSKQPIVIHNITNLDGRTVAEETYEHTDALMGGEAALSERWGR